MRFLRRVLRSSTRHALAVVALLAQLVAAIGAPTLGSHTNKKGSVPFPCQNHPCGCSTPEEGWAGDCCCFTLEQKLAWAEERGIEPPPHVRATVEARRAAASQVKAKPPCCAKHAKSDCCETAPGATHKHTDEPAAPSSLTVRWLAGIHVQKCHGDGPAGLFKFEAGTTPTQPGHPRALRPVHDFERPTDSQATSTPSCPPTPPPRVS
jgi:hypothetical protein